jgi:CubicO group peptidase (beta-lactamase class C family)
MRKSILLGSLILLNAAVFAQPSFVKDSLDQFINREMNRWNVPGLAIAIIKDTSVVMMKGYGYADIANKKKVDEQTLFQIASNSKAFTATALSMLEQQGKLSMSDKASKWIPYFKLEDQYASENTTIADLLSHKIGFQTFQGDFLNWGCNMKRKEIIENMRNLSPVYSFRDKFGYCNAAFLTAGEIIPAACDTSWDDFLKHRIFSPLQMTRTSTQWKQIDQDKLMLSLYNS